MLVNEYIHIHELLRQRTDVSGESFCRNHFVRCSVLSSCSSGARPRRVNTFNIPPHRIAADFVWMSSSSKTWGWQFALCDVVMHSNRKLVTGDRMHNGCFQKQHSFLRREFSAYARLYNMRTDGLHSPFLGRPIDLGIVAILWNVNYSDNGELCE